MCGRCVWVVRAEAILLVGRFTDGHVDWVGFLVGMSDVSESNVRASLDGMSELPVRAISDGTVAILLSWDVSVVVAYDVVGAFFDWAAAAVLYIYLGLLGRVGETYFASFVSSDLDVAVWSCDVVYRVSVVVLIYLAESWHL